MGGGGEGTNKHDKQINSNSIEAEFARFNSLIVLHNGSGFNRRLLQTTLVFPMLLLWFQHRPRRTPCPHRQMIANKIIETDADDLEINARKIKRTCQADLVEASQHGTTGPKLYMIIKAVATMIAGDSADLESTNNILKVIGRRSPRITLELLDARMKMKKKMLSESASMFRKAHEAWEAMQTDTMDGCAKQPKRAGHYFRSGEPKASSLSNFRATADNLHARLVECASNQLPAELVGVDRWGPPVPLTTLPTPAYVTKKIEDMWPDIRKTPQKRYGAAYSILWYNAFPRSDSTWLAFLGLLYNVLPPAPPTAQRAQAPESKHDFWCLQAPAPAIRHENMCCCDCLLLRLSV